MKKFLSVLSLIAILGVSTPAFANPHGGHHGAPPPSRGDGHHAPAAHHGHHIRPHGGFTIHAGAPRHRHWGYHRGGYWYNPCYNNRLGWYGDVCYPYGVYHPIHGASFSIRF